MIKIRFVGDYKKRRDELPLETQILMEDLIRTIVNVIVPQIRELGAEQSIQVVLNPNKFLSFITDFKENTMYFILTDQSRQD